MPIKIFGYGSNQMVVEGDQIEAEISIYPCGDLMENFIDRLRKEADGLMSPTIHMVQGPYDDMYKLVIRGWRLMTKQELKRVAEYRQLEARQLEIQSIVERQQYERLKAKYG